MESEQTKTDEGLAVQSIHATTHVCRFKERIYKIETPLVPICELRDFLQAVLWHVTCIIEEQENASAPQDKKEDNCDPKHNSKKNR